MKDLDELLSQALFEQSKRRRHSGQTSTRRRLAKTSTDYASRLSDRALYRRLIEQSDIAQDGLRFVWYFNQPSNHGGKSLEQWRRQIDKEIINARYRSALLASSSATRVDNQTGDEKSQIQSVSPPD